MTICPHLTIAACNCSCGEVANPRIYGATFTDPVCREAAGHSGTHVGVHRDGTRTGFTRNGFTY